jgi:hypothetical protein
MAFANGTPEADERTALLNTNTSKLNNDDINPAGNGNADGDVSKSGVGDGSDIDEEAGEVTEENPLFEGNEEMREKLYILCPAVAIAVSTLVPSHRLRGI